ncbi:MAG: bifunctional diaminohydroxyphosphoribosylaminopyrimidine deaminase/5-amino-6-(5-phosphoribosylamino)uracil reductase RibD [Micrococcales bacterium]|nr:bifunctional diaminohydroxyphosphoribosylaminopyrimidine deaminase/5-amino-6-(5-phosphoribosylamino)uracil reductase RibD [Micrococcales bacterium]
MTTAELDVIAMRRALALAQQGPVVGGNPQVGCVLVEDTGRVVAEGWHRGAGSPHAEIDALSHTADARGLTAVVTLEPCDHWGRTGPCSIALIDAGIRRVVYAVPDPSRTAGGGGATLAAAGVAVTAGVLRAEVEDAIRPWLTAERLGRPWVVVKWAASLDGRTAAADGSSRWITGTAARQRVHEERAHSDAILVGTGTVLADDPALTARGDAGELQPHQPLPVVVGERRVPTTAALRRHPGGLWETGTRDLAAVLSGVFDRGLRRVYVEGGPTLASAVLAAGLADELSVYLAPTLIGGPHLAVGDLGIPDIAHAHRLRFTDLERLGDDLHLRARAADPLAPSPEEG